MRNFLHAIWYGDALDERNAAQGSLPKLGDAVWQAQSGDRGLYECAAIDFLNTLWQRYRGDCLIAEECIYANLGDIECAVGKLNGGRYSNRCRWGALWVVGGERCGEFVGVDNVPEIALTDLGGQVCASKIYGGVDGVGLQVDALEKRYHL